MLGRAEGGTTGLALLRESVATLEDSPARLERARSFVELGAALRRANKRNEAREMLRAGLELARQCEAGALGERAHEELIAAGASRALARSRASSRSRQASVASQRWPPKG